MGLGQRCWALRGELSARPPIRSLRDLVSNSQFEECLTREGGELHFRYVPLQYDERYPIG
jgi:hypothetical protein